MYDKNLNMRLLFCAISILLFHFSTHAQIGISGGIKKMTAPEWEAYFEGDDFLRDGFKIGLDYWFRLKEKRVEFTPELSYSQFSSNIDHFTEGFTQNFKVRLIGLHLNTNIYPLDFGNDCNCPTFDKDGGILDKGLFLQISLGISTLNNEFENPLMSISSNQLIPSLGLGVGLDIGINKFLTLTPLIQYHFYFNATWEDLELLAAEGQVFPADANETSNLKQFFAGLRLSMRFDEINKYGYR